MSASSTVNYSDFKTIFIDLFFQDTSLNGSLWAIRWGTSQMVFDSNGLTLTSTAASGWAPVGFEQATTGKSAGEGYGLYQFTGYADAGQGEGIAFLLWRADNLTVDPSMPGIATEIDVLESWDGTKTGESTIHYYSPSAPANDGYQIHQYAVNLTVSHTYAVDWERGSLTFYLDGQELYQDTLNVPLDYADGGSNEVMGAEVVPPKNATGAQVQLHISQMEYSAPVPPAPSVTLGSGPQSYAALAGDTVQAGSGSDTVTAPAGSVFVLGGSGTLTFQGSVGLDTVTGGSGSSTIIGATGGGNYAGGSGGNNVLVSHGASGSNTTLTGGGSGDRLFGSANGNDTLYAKTGSETIVGSGGGSETVIGGGTAACVIFTGSGATRYQGGVFGGDLVVGGSGALSATAVNGDAIFGGSGALSVTGTAAGGNADSVIGGSGALTFTGQGANALVVAGSGNSTISTGDGATLIFGASGAATITGGASWMGVVLGAGKLTTHEGSGPAQYDIVNGAAGGSAQITGFRPGTDSIDLYGYASSQVHISSGSTSSTLSLSDGTTVQLIGVTNPGSSIVV